jgi:lysophospholipase L1-like esterase
VKNDDLRICFIGDSFVNGTNDPEYLGWTGRISALARSRGYPLTCYNLGIRRDTSNDIARRWLPEARCRLPEHCRPFLVFSFGVNDTTLENGRTRVAEAESVENTRQILKAAQGVYSVLLVGPPPIADHEQNQRTEHLSRRMSEAAAQDGVPYLSVFEALSQDSVWMAEVSADDGAHPRAAGYEKLAALVDQWHSWWFK